MEQRLLNSVTLEKVQAHMLQYRREVHPLVLQQSRGECAQAEQLQSLYEVLEDMHASLARDMALLKFHLPGSPENTHKQSTPSSMRSLSEKEREVLNIFARGYSYSEAGDLLNCKLATIQTYAKRIYRKLNVHSRAEAIFEASHLGLIQI